MDKELNIYKPENKDVSSPLDDEPMELMSIGEIANANKKAIQDRRKESDKINKLFFKKIEEFGIKLSDADKVEMINEDSYARLSAEDYELEVFISNNEIEYIKVIPDNSDYFIELEDLKKEENNGRI